jgi:hypothetical protein
LIHPKTSKSLYKKGGFYAIRLAPSPFETDENIKLDQKNEPTLILDSSNPASVPIIILGF